MDSLKARRRAVPPFGVGPSGGGSALVLALAATLAICEVARGQTPAPRASPSPAPTPSKSAQPDPDDEDPDTPQVTVTAHKLPAQPGAVIGDIKPELQLSPSDVQSYGVSTVTELLNELSPETRSDRGRGGETPVVLLNGRRISSFNEIQNIPTEAILRVDILPEEVSLKYGYTADQRVVNIVLRRRFHAITAEAVGGGATEGGEETGQAELDLLHLHGDSRLNLDLKYQATSQITEAARGITEAPAGAPFALGGNVAGSQPGGEIDPGLSALVGEPVTVAGVPISASGQALALSDFVPTAGVPNTTDLGADRTLQPATQQLTANAVMSRPAFWGFTATLNGTLGASTSAALQGLPSLALLVPPGDPFSPFGDPVTVDRYIGSSGPLRQTVTGWTAHLGSTLNRDLGDWRLSLTDAYDHADTQTDTEVGVASAPLQTLLDTLSPAFDPFTPPPSALVQALPETLARSLSDSANIQVLTNGPLLKIPAGPIYVSAKLGDTASVENSTSLRLGAFQALSLSRNDVNAQFNFDLPLTSRSNHVFGVVGDLSVNVNTAVDVLSDFGVLPTFGYGVNWTPVEGVNLIVSHTHDHAAPTLQQLDGPVIYTPGVRLFDYATGQTVDVTQVTGGQPALKADNRNVIKIGLTLKPLASENFTVTANYIHSVIDNPIETFPAADAAIEAAFPDRFIRNAEGELTEEDDRPVNFASQDREELRWGLNYSRPLGPQPPPRFDRRRFAAARQRQAAAEGAGAAGGAGGEASGGPSPGPGGGSGAGSDGGGRPRGGGGRFGGGAPAAGRLQFAIYHTIIFKDQFLVRSGGPVLDLLNGAPASSTGGQYQQEVQAQLGATLFGFGARLSADWRSATVVKGASGLAADTLSFSDIATINLRLFDNLGQQKPVLARFPWLRGARVTLNVLNLFDQRIEVRDGVGVTPLSYQGGYLDPVGRTITLSLRKLFY